MFIADLFVIVQNKQKNMSINRKMDTYIVVYSYNAIYSNLMNELYLHTAARMSVTGIVLSERSQTEKHNRTRRFYYYSVGTHDDGYISEGSNYRGGSRGLEVLVLLFFISVVVT